MKSAGLLPLRKNSVVFRLMNLSRSFIIVSLLQEWSSTLTINKQKAWVEKERPLQLLKWQPTQKKDLCYKDYRNMVSKDLKFGKFARRNGTLVKAIKLQVPF